MTTMEETRRDLIALRTSHGADTAIGHHCSNIVELIDNFSRETDREVKTRLADNIQKQNGRLAKLLAAARQ